VNTVMMIGCLALALTFKESSRLAAAYGIAVTGTMAITTRFIINVPVITGLARLEALLPCVSSCSSIFPISAPICFKFIDGGWIAVGVASF